MDPEVSVVVPTRNRRDLLERTLGCILGQEGVELEVVVVDEASSDGTGAMLDAMTDGRLRVVRHERPRRLPGARNAGLAVAGAPWVAFCDDDDLWAPTKLRAQLDAMAESGARWSVTGVVNVDVHDRITGHGRAVGGDLAERLRMGNVIPGGGSAVVAEAGLVREVGGFDEELPAVEDYDMWVRLGARSPLAAVDRPLAAYRVWPGSMSSDVVRQRAARELVVSRYRGDLSTSATRAMDLRHRRYLARTHLRRGDRLAGFRDYLDIAIRYRDGSQAVHALGALLAPAATEARRARAELAAVPAAWRAEAEAWLRQIPSTRGAAA